ncbi:MAG: FAD-binding oxidoreductase [Flavobacteriales bacterium]|nr:FAD-binding oxidoreductase [Flavobacteriales bacterium]
MSFPPNISYWEINQYFRNVDLLIVGSGIVGLTTAIFYKKAHPSTNVLIIEKGTLPAGASTKNAGFACFGSASEILSDLNTVSADDVYNLVSARINGLKELRLLVGDRNLAYEECGGFEVFRKEDSELFEKCTSFIPNSNIEIEARTGMKQTYIIADNRIPEFGFSGVEHLLLNQHEGALDTGRMMAHLIKLAASLEITILNGCEVAAFTDLGSAVEVELKNGITLSPKHLNVATNGFATSLLPKLDVKPARAQVLITTPIENLKVKGTFHLNEGYYYFRNVGERLLLGGGRQLDKEEEAKTELEITELIQNNLNELLKTVILPSTHFKIEHRWAGIMGVGDTKKAIVERVSENVSCSVRLGGMGVAIGTSIGKQSAELIG